MEFESFKLEESSACQFDYVTMFDGASRDMPIIATLCGEVRSGTVFTGSTSVMLVYFKSDFSLTYSGFKAHFYGIIAGA